jgi:transcriptional regulator with XRE-family HTH domain
MNPKEETTTLVPRQRIARTVRALRKERAWTQGELAKQLGLSQSRFSEIENGDGSFTAEQFLRILQLFNVTISRFTDQVSDEDTKLQNALVRAGALHLQESPKVIPEEIGDDIPTLIRDGVASGDPRLTTGVAPVLVAQVDKIRLGKVYLDLARIGLEPRLAWLIENIVEAIRGELADNPPRAWGLAALRTTVILESFLASISGDLLSGGSSKRAPDVLDPTIRSKKTLSEVEEASSPISRKWGIVTTLSPKDFQQALRGARVARP